MEAPTVNNRKGRIPASSTVEEESAAGDETFDATLVSSDYEDDETNNTASQGTVLVSSVDTFDKKQRQKMLIESGIKAFNAKKRHRLLPYAGILSLIPSVPTKRHQDTCYKWS